MEYGKIMFHFYEVKILQILSNLPSKIFFDNIDS